MNKALIAQLSLIMLGFPDGTMEIARIDNIKDVSDKSQEIVNPGQQVAIALAVHTENMLRAGTLCNLIFGDIDMGFVELRCICT